jgi:transcriptional regulator with XRE-family HTH domain
MQGSLAERLRVLRAQRGLTLVEAAEETGVGRDTLSDLERGRRHPVMPTLTKIARGYGVPVEELLEEPVLVGKAEAPQEPGQSGQEWARELKARLHGMTDEEWTAHVRALESEEEVAREYRALIEETKMLHDAHSLDKWQHPEDKDRRAALSRDLRELRTYRFAELAAAAKLRNADDALLREMIQATYDVAV